MIFPTLLMIQIADFLNIIIFQSGLIYINFWSILHLASGFLVMKYLVKDNSFYKLFGLLVLYEIFEVLVISSGSSLFRAELYADQFFDILIGLLGGWVATKVKW